MRCYKCNSVLAEGDYCLKCGADVSVYKVVVKASNSYYNAGLAKAQVRDLSGAVTALRTSIDINKSNIKARNLLGLVYYEMGEIAQAISEWVISANLKPDKNVAQVYLHKLKSNPNKLDALNKGIKKYNFSLARIKEGGEDVGFIQLKKALTLNPKHIKSMLLLALMYLKRTELEKMIKVLQRVLKIDRNNTLALRYLDEITKSGIAAESKNDDGYKMPVKKNKVLSGNDIIIPKSSYKEPSSGALNVMLILLGVIIGVAITWFLVLPSKLQTTKSDSNATIKKYSEQLSSYSVKITDLENEITDLEDKLEAARDEILDYTGENGESKQYEQLIEAVSAYIANDYETAAAILAKIDVTQLPTDTAKNLYTTMLENSDGGARELYQAGVTAYNQEKYTEALTKLINSYNLDNSTVETPYYLALTYIALKENDNAQIYIDIVNTQYANTTYATELNQYLREHPLEENETTEAEQPVPEAETPAETEGE